MSIPPVLVQLIIGLATPLVTLIGVLIANSKAQALTEYKIEELSQRVDKHNNLIERTYHIEEKLKVVETKLEFLDK